MKIFRNILPILLIIWPYLFCLCFLIPEEAENVFGIMTLIYVISTVPVYGLNIWNAWSYPKEEAMIRLPLYNMLLKLLHIPFYIGVFVLGIVSLAIMVVPALVFVSPIIIMYLVFVDCLLMITTSMYGIRSAVLLYKKGWASKTFAVIQILLHLCFVTDVISAICVFVKARIVKRKGFV